ncbi:BnaA04g11160D [Brassica napus]|uniref:BnaA04g11160D protein n=1 Tax=Brassica napus TaxID=3708 RepID=A0A078HPF5_BRANA|nr:BnaA04g11160D [Brassica napus]
MLGTPTDVANVYVLTIPPNRVAMFHRAPRLHQEFSLTRMCLRQLITSLSMCWLRSEDPYVASMFIALEVTKVETLTIGEIYAFLRQEPIQVVCLPVLPDVRTTCADQSPQTLKLKMSFNHKVIFRASYGGTTHKETLQLLMNLGTYVARFTVERWNHNRSYRCKSTILHYASYGGDMSPMLNQIME